MRVELELVTPEKANELLTLNGHNRSLSRNRVRNLAAQMRSGEWQLNGETIIVSSTGRLLDGQHRLKAVTEFGRPVQMLVAYGAPDDSFTTIDTGKARSIGDIVGMHGYGEGGAVAAAGKILWQQFHNQALVVSVPPAYAIKIAQRYPSLLTWTAKMNGMGKGTIVPRSVLVAALVYLEDIAKKPATAQHFYAGVIEGAGLDEGSPILALRNRLIRARASGARIDAKWALPLTMKAVSAFEEGRKAERFRLTQSSGSAEKPDMFDYHVRSLTPKERLSDLLPPERVKES